MKEYKIAVFPHKRTKGYGYYFNAYTTYYNPEWDGCNIVYIKGDMKAVEAKKKAINHVKIMIIQEPDKVKICKDYRNSRKTHAFRHGDIRL